jgi:DHA1 family bicyclomycin/chloramphenicol resistance-like MFS transporter
MTGELAARKDSQDSHRTHDAALPLLLGLLSTIGAFSIDAFFPSLRAIAQEFHITAWQAQQTLTAYMLPYAVISLLHGSLSDALGRRRPILVALALYSAASLGCAAAPTFGSLLLFRAVQGLVAGAGQVIGRAIVRDHYHGPDAQRLMSLITLIFGLGPAAAPIIGGWVHALLGWRAVFGAMAVLGLSMLIFTSRRLPETHPPEKRTPLHLGQLAQHSRAVISSVEFLLLASGSALSFAALQVYMGAAPAIVLDHWHLDETKFAALNLPIIGGYMIGAVLSGRLAGRIPPQRQATIGFRLLLVMSAAMLVLQSIVAAPPISVQQLLLAGTGFGLQLMFPIVTLRVLDLFPNSRGAASSMQSFLALITGAVTMGFLAPLLAQSMRHIAMAALITACAGSLLWWLAQRYRVAHRLQPQAPQEATCRH